MLAKAEISHNHMPSGWNLLDLLILKLMLTIFFFFPVKLRTITCFFVVFYFSVLNTSRTVELTWSLKMGNYNVLSDQDWSIYLLGQADF